MPFKSEAQRGYFEANKKRLESQGIDVREWERASKGKDLPKRVPHPSRPKTYKSKRKD